MKCTPTECESESASRYTHTHASNLENLLNSFGNAKLLKHQFLWWGLRLQPLSGVIKSDSSPCYLPPSAHSYTQTCWRFIASEREKHHAPVWLRHRGLHTGTESETHTYCCIFYHINTLNTDKQVLPYLAFQNLTSMQSKTPSRSKLFE